MFQVPPSVQRLALEIQGWLDLNCPEHALLKLTDLLAVPGARPTALSLRITALIATHEYTDAISDLNEVRHFDHDADWADVNEAWCHKRLNDLPAAIQCMERLVVRSNHYATGHFNLGCYLALAGEPERAIAEVSVACGIDSSLRELLAEESDLDSLRDYAEFQDLLTS